VNRAMKDTTTVNSRVIDAVFPVSDLVVKRALTGTEGVGGGK
jgi:hypothetical protein